MDLDSLRECCLALPHATEGIQWENVLLFRVSGRMFAVVSLDAVPLTLSFKCSEEEFLELQEVEGIGPAPYLARAKWVQLESLNTLPAAELERRLRRSYELVYAKLPARTRAALERPARRKRVRRA